MRYLTIILLFCTSLLFAQNERVFTGKCSVQQTGSGAGYWALSVTNFNEPGGLYDATEIDTGDYVYFSDSGISYSLEITSVISAVGASANIRVSNVGVTGLSSVPTTSSAFISRGTSNFNFIPFVSNIPNNENQIQQEHNAYLFDSLLNAAKPYYSLHVLIQQDSTEDPVMTILQNDLQGPTPVLVNESTGWWEIQSTGSFTPGKTFIEGTCSYPTGNYSATGNYPSISFYGAGGAKTGTMVIIPGNANFVGIMILDASGNPSDLSPFITIDDINGTFSMPEIKVFK